MAFQKKLPTTQDADPYLLAKRYCIAISGGVSARKLLERLCSLGFSLSLAQAAVDRCRNEELFDEDALAQSLGRLAARKGKTQEQLLGTLFRRGVEKKYFSNAIKAMNQYHKETASE